MDKNRNADQELYDKWHQDPANWKMGIFYFNKADKRIFPPKRHKMLGWTINFANPGSVLALLGMFVIVWVVMSFLRTGL